MILAGVHHWDSNSLDSVLPRCLMPVALSPLAGYVVDWFGTGGIDEITICANSASRVVRAVLRDGRAFDAAFDYYEDITPRGPAGCLRDVAVESEAETLIVADGSHVPPFDLSALISAHRSSQAAMSVVLSSYDPATGANDGRLRPVGVYAIEARALRDIPASGYCDVKEGLIPALRAANEAVLPYVVHEPDYRVSDLAGYLSTQEYILTRITRGDWVAPDFVRIGDAFVHRSADVASDCRLLGPCLIGPGTRVDRGAIIVGPSVIGSRCRIESKAVVSRSSLWDNTTVFADAHVDGAVLAFGTRVRPRGRVCHTIAVSSEAHWVPRPQTGIWRQRDELGGAAHVTPPATPHVAASR